MRDLRTRRYTGHRPGIYSMSPYTSEEIVTRQLLAEDKLKGIINIVDATKTSGICIRPCTGWNWIFYGSGIEYDG